MANGRGEPWGHVPSETDTEGPSGRRILWMSPVTFKRGRAKQDAVFAYCVPWKIFSRVQ